MAPREVHLSHPKYRPDIDGLRAFAVLSVIGFHAFPDWVKGGFVGVDIFFVISGFLISTIIFESIENGTFTFREFYARRIRRIFPSLLFVLAASYVFGWYALLADEYKQLGKHIAAGAAFISNFVLRNELGYFDNAADTKPLLHLWSLGIEEQFYILWPFLLWMAWKRKFNLLFAIALVALFSFYLNLRGVAKNPAGAFYLPQTRFWELVCGSLLAWMATYAKSWLISDRRTISNAFSVGGVMLLAYGVWRIDKGVAFPGMWAAIPVLGAMLVISAGPAAWLNRVALSNRIAVWFGLISFPLYLWHWPLLSFARIVESEAPTTRVRIMAVLLAILLAWLTYEFVEKPIRFGSPRRSKVLVPVALMVLVGFVGYRTDVESGLAFRDAEKMKAYEGDIGYNDYFNRLESKFIHCKNRRIYASSLKYGKYVRCMQSLDSEDVEMALIGDSHAEHLFLGLADSLPNRNVAYYIKAGLPFKSNDEFGEIFEEVERSKSIKKVVLAAFWSRRFSELPRDTDPEQELLKTVDFLLASGKEVYLANNIPMFPFDPAKCMLRRRFSTKDQFCMMPRGDVEAKASKYKQIFSSVLARNSRVRHVDVEKHLCDDTYCRMVNGTDLLYKDNRHLNTRGSMLVGRSIIAENPDLAY